MAANRRIEVDDALVRPGTYFNPQTEVMIVVDDSASLDREIFNLEEFEGADWVLVSEEVPVDEDQRDQLFENFPELIIAAFALNKGLHEVVKASIVGSIISNILLVLGFSMFVGGWKNGDQRFSQQAVHAQAAMLLLALAALVLPAVFQLAS